MDNNKQKKIANKLINDMETMDENEFENLYNQLDVDYQLYVDRAVREFADFAVGSEHWDSDN
ncbi:hypothetical protein JSY36_03450 [Bacillus sp. H-16]|uniref:hypothetical protein n=1 Tax=Alteribacter salitolerans TaxID=2912333 RepID=UPI001966C26E|nr:hypothetical protein [Alteribacter salitolerans]MBM7094803.1 hypothetical protein [Alteribacter salitolerans]